MHKGLNVSFKQGIAMALAVAGLWSGAALAQTETYPARPVTLVSPYPPGGGVDHLARALLEPLQRSLKQSVTISYRPGAAAAVGTASVANAAPDGYTIMLGAASTVTIPEVDRLLERAHSYSLDQLVPVALISVEPTLLIVHPSLPAKTAREFLELARAHPGELVVSSGGYYGPSHLPILLLERAAGVRFRHLVGTGGGPAMAAVLSGNAVAYAAPPAVASPHIAAGRARLLATWSDKRVPAFPDVPTFKELGIDAQFYDWYAVFAPAQTPRAVLEVLRRALRQATQAPEFRAAMDKDNEDADYLDGDALKAWYAREQKWRIDAVRAIGKIETK
jgi:tripartite-type tricarboxylate transporter receptor subunit TctC